MKIITDQQTEYVAPEISVYVLDPECYLTPSSPLVPPIEEEAGEGEEGI